ncbi:MAG: hypothetical protein IT572_06425 [Deltaproteobacteria bacterium]|nr:hypothetical protein [Deltaproteobacteria bacterium]
MTLLSASFCMLWLLPYAHAQEKTTTTTTTVESVTQTPTAPTTTRRSKRVRRAPAPADTTAVTSTTVTTTEVKPPPPKEVVRKVYDEEMLKKMSKTLCTEGFKAYVGTDKKNVCMNRATPPDLAYSCVWDKKGTPAFAPTPQGPCNLDYTVHADKVTVKKDNFPSNPPLSYGMEAQCCFRAAKGLEPATASQ